MTTLDPGTMGVVRRLARRVGALEQLAFDHARAQQAADRSVEGGGTQEFYDDDDELRAIVGPQTDGAYAITTYGGPVPPTPSVPLVAQYPGGATISWDGFDFNDEQAWPDNFARVHVHLATVPGEPATDDTFVASIESVKGGAISVAQPSDVTTYCTFVAVTTAGIESPPSYEVEVTGGANTFEPPVLDPPASSPTPAPLVGPAAVVVNYEPLEDAVADLYLWVAPAATPGDAPPPIADDTYLHTREVAPGAFIYADVDGTPLPPARPVWVALWARNSGGSAPAPSAWVETAVGQIDPAYLQLLAGTVIAQRLQGETVQGVDILGSTLNIFDLLIADEDGVEIKAELLEAASAIFYGNVTRRGVANYLEGTEVASAGVTDPGTPATVTNVWPFKNLTGAGGWARVGMVEISSTEVVIIENNLGGYLRAYNPTTGAFIREKALNATSFAPMRGLCKIGSYFYTLEFEDSDNSLRLRRYIATVGGTWGNRDTGYDVVVLPDAYVTATPRSVGLGTDGTGLFIVWLNQNNRYRLYYRSNPATTTALSPPDYDTLPSSVSPSTTSDGIAGVISETLVWPVCYIQPMNGPQVAVHKPSGSWVELDTNKQVLPYGRAVVAACANRTLDADDRYYSHSPDRPGTRPYTYTWYDSDSGGVGLGESRPSPPRSFNQQPGAYVNIKVPAPPDDGSSDAPNTVRLYVDNFRQSGFFTTTELAAGRTFAGPALSGSPAPTTSDFDSRPNLTPGNYQSAKGNVSGPYWKFEGTGDAKVGPFEFDASTGLATLNLAITNLDLWHTVGGSGEPGFVNGWTSRTGDDVVRFRKMASGVVQIVGAANAGSNNTTVFTLPSGYRPSYPISSMVVNAQGTGASARVTINTNGTVVVSGLGSATWVSLAVMFAPV